jgi:hypothetical protein
VNPLEYNIPVLEENKIKDHNEDDEKFAVTNYSKVKGSNSKFLLANKKKNQKMFKNTISDAFEKRKKLQYLKKLEFEDAADKSENFSFLDFDLDNWSYSTKRSDCTSSSRLSDTFSTEKENNDSDKDNHSIIVSNLDNSENNTNIMDEKLFDVPQILNESENKNEDFNNKIKEKKIIWKKLKPIEEEDYLKNESFEEVFDRDSLSFLKDDEDAEFKSSHNSFSQRMLEGDESVVYSRSNYLKEKYLPNPLSEDDVISKGIGIGKGLGVIPSHIQRL